FLAGIFINPPYRFAPEDNLAYRDVILLHQAAIQQIVQHDPGAVVLTAWPVTDELRKPELGYVPYPIDTVAVDNFSFDQVEAAARLAPEYSVALVFSTKYDPPHPWLSLGRRNEAMDTRYFDFHRDLPPSSIAHLLGGIITWHGERHGEWAAVLRFDRPQEARLPLHPFQYNQP
ncbi:MAG: glycosyltransferase, partial [Acidobacterium ailaaui]|nr:glycosyltransferase [Pseudacidobacterium ailaaui]